MAIKRVGVLGLGTQGQGIVEVASRSGFEVVVTTRSRESLDRGLRQVGESMRKAVKKGRLDEADMQSALSRIKGTLNPEDFGECDILIEAIRELIDEKKAAFSQYDRICKPTCIFASDTSTLPIIEMAMATKRPDKVIGTHFFWPVPVMPLCEIAVSILTSEESFNITRDFAIAIGKEPARVKDSPGFITSYMMIATSLECVRLYERGIASMEEIDHAMEKGLSYPMGLFRLNDLAGIDTLFYSQRALYEMTKNPIFAPVLLVDKLMAAGHLGRKTGKGFYDYADKKRH
jgi:3-hydroxybutyryl-CoA dehydrogenase